MPEYPALGRALARRNALRHQIEQDQPETVHLLRTINDHILDGLERANGIPLNQCRALWGAFLVVAVDGLTMSIEHLLNGFPALAYPLLRGALEGASVVGGVSVMDPSEQEQRCEALLAELQKIRRQGAGRYGRAMSFKDTVRASEYRKVLEAKGNDTIKAVAGRMRDSSEMLNLYAHSSLYTIGLVHDDHGVLYGGYYTDDDVAISVAHNILLVAIYVMGAVQAFLGNMFDDWDQRNRELQNEIMAWIRLNMPEGTDASPDASTS
jgi:hypothetical protein